MAKIQFICWKPDLGETEESDGRPFEEYHPATAAEQAVERNFWDDPSDEDVRVDVRVPLQYLKDEYDGKQIYGPAKYKDLPVPTCDEVQKFVVHVESQPAFNARLLKDET
jgi:hypothetical protein